MVRRRYIEHVGNNVTVILECGCRVIVDAIVLFETKTLPCVWSEKHGTQKWIRFGPIVESDYRWKCNQRGCKTERNWDTKFLQCNATAHSHSRIHAHPVSVYADTWKGLDIVPDLLPDTIPF